MARKDGQIYKLILDNDTLIQIWKFPNHMVKSIKMENS
jgi:hypothetical protein